MNRSSNISPIVVKPPAYRSRGSTAYLFRGFQGYDTEGREAAKAARRLLGKLEIRIYFIKLNGKHCSRSESLGV